MIEDLGDIVGSGFNTWKNNLNICLPFVFSYGIATILRLIIMGLAFYVTIPSFFSLFINPVVMSPPGLILKFLPQILQNISLIITAFIITRILNSLVGSFFYSGVIGMAKEATKTGQTNLSDMVKYGRKKFISLFFANIIVGLIVFGGVIFLIPGVFNILPDVSTLLNLQLSELIEKLAVFGMGFIAMIAYMIITGIVLTLSPFAVVIDDLRAIEGVKKGYRVFMENKSDVFLLWLIVIVIISSILASLGVLFGATPYIGGMVFVIIYMAISITILNPLTFVWWTRLYLNTPKSVD